MTAESQARSLCDTCNSFAVLMDGPGRRTPVRSGGFAAAGARVVVVTMDPALPLLVIRSLVIPCIFLYSPTHVT